MNIANINNKNYKILQIKLVDKNIFLVDGERRHSNYGKL